MTIFLLCRQSVIWANRSDMFLRKLVKLRCFLILIQIFVPVGQNKGKTALLDLYCTKNIFFFHDLSTKMLTFFIHRELLSLPTEVSMQIAIATSLAVISVTSFFSIMWHHKNKT